MPSAAALITVVASALSAAAASRVTACKGQSELALRCQTDERISIKSVSYAYDPKPCDSPTDQNDCTSQSLVLSQEAADRCNGQSSCHFRYIDPMDYSEVARELRDPSQCQIGNTFYTSQDLSLNYMSIVYDCKAYEFCNEEPSHRSKNIVVKTIGYPALRAPTNPACSCEFASDDRNINGLTLSASCPGSNVTFRVQTRALFGGDSTRNPSAVVEVHCFNATVSSLIEVASSVPQGSAISVWAHEEKSDERSAYSIVVLAVKHNGEFDTSSFVNISCKAGGIFFTKSERLVFAVVIPVGLVFFIVLIVVCKVVKRRNRRAAKRRKAEQAQLVPYKADRTPEKAANGRSGAEIENLLQPVDSSKLLEERQYESPRPKTSPAVVATAAAPGKQSSKVLKHVTEQIRADPEGEDLVQFATQLHKLRLLQEETASLHSSLDSSSRPGSRPASMAIDFRPTIASLGRRPPGMAPARPVASAPTPPAAAAQVDDGSRPVPQLSQQAAEPTPDGPAAQPMHRMHSAKRMPAPPPPPAQPTAAGAQAVAAVTRPQQPPPSAQNKPQLPPKPSKPAAPEPLPRDSSAHRPSALPAGRDAGHSLGGPPKPARLHMPAE